MCFSQTHTPFFSRSAGAPPPSPPHTTTFKTRTLFHFEFFPIYTTTTTYLKRSSPPPFPQNRTTLFKTNNNAFRLFCFQFKKPATTKNDSSAISQTKNGKKRAVQEALFFWCLSADEDDERGKAWPLKRSRETEHGRGKMAFSFFFTRFFSFLSLSHSLSRFSRHAFSAIRRLLGASLHFRHELGQGLTPEKAQGLFLEEAQGGGRSAA